MFRAQSAHHQEVKDANCTYAASGIVTLCKWLSCATAKEGLRVVAQKKKKKKKIGHMGDILRYTCHTCIQCF